MDFYEFQYNSNFNCLCTKNTSKKLVQEELPRVIPTYNTQHLNLNPTELHSETDPDNNIPLNADFGYYDVHEFHKKVTLQPFTEISGTTTKNDVVS